MRQFELKKDLIALREEWRKLPNYACWWSSPDNPKGLQLTPNIEVGKLWLEQTLEMPYTSFPGIAHGGYSYTILDGMMGWYIMAHFGRAGVTTQTTTFYRGPLILGNRYLFEAIEDPEVTPIDGVVAMLGKVFDLTRDPKQSKPVLVIKAQFFLPTREQAGKLLNIQLGPEAEAFFPAG